MAKNSFVAEVTFKHLLIFLWQNLIEGQNLRMCVELLSYKKDSRIVNFQYGNSHSGLVSYSDATIFWNWKTKYL